MIDFAALHAAQDRAIAGILPMGEREGRGIVTTAYGAEFASSWVQLSELVRLGCQLPIEVWHRPGELTPEQLRLLGSFNLDLRLAIIPAPVTGWATKMAAIRHSGFAEVLWLDADNTPIREPSFLFSDPGYQATGLLLWRDVSGIERANRWHDQSPVWEAFRVPYCEIEEIEAGQIVIDMQRHWSTFNLALHYNLNPRPYYDLLHGDKDTLKLAALFLCQPFSLMPFGPFHVGEPNPWQKWGGGSVMQQRDRFGRPLFNHRSIDKFSLESENGKPREHRRTWELYGPAEDEIYHRHLARLRAATALREIVLPPVL